MVGKIVFMTKCEGKCDNCLCNLERCHAECCKLFLIKATPHQVYKKGMIIYFECKDEDMQLYYSLHGCGVMGDTILIPLDEFKVIKNMLHISMQCKYLDDNNQCMHHADGLQPKICAYPNKDTIQPGDNKKIWITPNCVYGDKHG